MQTRRVKRKINGWLNVDKPQGMTSAQVVGRVKYLLRPEKIGHAGTLDPLATGVLPLALGKATKTILYLQESAKSYRFTVKWGESRATDDSEGEITATSDRRPERQDIEKLLPKYRGDIMQRPCDFSAVKINGERAYDLARAGKKVELEPRPIRIDRFELVNMLSPDEAEFEVTCGKGSYMRGLARDLGQDLGCFGHLTAIRRLSVGPFGEKSAITLDLLEEFGHKDASGQGAAAMPLPPMLLPIDAALDDIPAYALIGEQAQLLRQGQGVVAFSPQAFSKPVKDGDTVRAMLSGRMVALCKLEEGLLRPVKITG